MRKIVGHNHLWEESSENRLLPLELHSHPTEIEDLLRRIQQLKSNLDRLENDLEDIILTVKSRKGQQK